MSKLPKVVVPGTMKNKKKNKYDAGAYLVKIDVYQKERHEFKREDGTTGILYIDRSSTNDHRERHQNVAEVISYSGEVDFKDPGTKLICNHFSFADHTDELHPIFKDERGDLYFKVFNDKVYFGVVSGEIIPRKGNLLCEPVKEKLYDTFLELPDTLVENRRDLVKIIKTWAGCTEYKEGDYALIIKNADYPFMWEGKEYIKVDTVLSEVLLTVPPSEVGGVPDIKKGEILRHMTEAQRTAKNRGR